MKLLMATHALANLAGAPLHTVDLCRGFRRAGHEVAVFALELGTLSDSLAEEGFPVFSLKDYGALSNEPFDLVYLHHATCETLLGIMFAGKVPIVRGYLGKRSRVGYPVNGGFASANLYLSEGIRETMNGMSQHNKEAPSIIARNVYDESQFTRGVALEKVRPGKPNFAIVSNHLDANLTEVLETLAGEGHCAFAHFGYPDNSVPVTEELLEPFDAVITIFRTTLPAAAMGIPVYVSDIGGSDGWLTQENYQVLRNRSFSGRRLAIKDQGLIREHLLDTDQWPTSEDLAWLSAQVEQDHALSRRIEELEGFFARIIEDAAPPAAPPEGYRAVFNYIREKEEGFRRMPGDRSRRSELARSLKAAENESKERASTIQQLQRRLKRQRVRIRKLESQLDERRGVKLRKLIAYVKTRVLGK